ncbi:TIGR01777 family oxidoreductase [Kocuria massiliensis]|uniref:TIGR01777 family oxidoreductase n=1 Tax=Kocuria massiliensis TaxID=1926282 RepID=UPI0022B94EB6|nr:TIGR01777 family oxidoreductase [Kocuria massiliensis]
MTTYRHRALLDHSRSEVTSWYARPGAVVRLSPPWSTRVISGPSDGLEVGSRTELRMGPQWADGLVPGAFPVRPGARWLAEHTEFRPGESFTDVMVRGPLRSWKHRHDFLDAGTDGAEVADTVDYELPSALRGRFLRGEDRLEAELDRVFAYRTDQTRADLDFAASLRRVPGAPWEPLKIAVAGSSGLVGTQLTALLRGAGHQVFRLERRTGYSGELGAGRIAWDPTQHRLDPAKLIGIDAVINLAGEPIFGAFTAKHRRALLESRLNATETIVEAMREAADRGGPGALINASASGYYGHDAGEVDEDSAPGEDFLAGLCFEWEKAALRAEEFGTRVVTVRTGLVLSAAGGLLAAQLPLYFGGAGGPLGGGNQWQPWISVDDMAQIYALAAISPRLSGPVNAAAPNPVRQRDFARSLGEVVHRPSRLPTPRQAPRLLLGRQATEELALSSAAMVPRVLTDAGYVFRFPELDGALRHTLGRTVA